MFDKLIDLIITWIKWFRVFIVVHEYETGVILRLGKFKRVAGPGVAWVIPLDVDELYPVPTYIQTMQIGPQSLVTKDGKEIVVSTLITHTVGDPKLYVLSIQGSEQAVEDTAYGVVAKFIMDRNWEEVITEDVGKELTVKMRQRTDDYGIKVKSAQLVDLTKSRSIRLISHAPNKSSIAHVV